jgi:hypothetical protein
MIRYRQQSYCWGVPDLEPLLCATQFTATDNVPMRGGILWGWRTPQSHRLCELPHQFSHHCVAFDQCGRDMCGGAFAASARLKGGCKRRNGTGLGVSSTRALEYSAASRLGEYLNNVLEVVPVVRYSTPSDHK